MNLLRILFPKAYNKAKFKLKDETIPGQKKPLVKHEVAYTFSYKMNGKTKECFRFVNDLNMSMERAFAAQDIYAELDQKTDSLYHQGAYKAILEYLSQGKNMDAGVVAWNALEKQKEICNWDLMYKLASVLYFDEDENAYRYDVAYNQEKIKAWKEDPDIEGFFLKTGFSEYLTLFNSSSGMNLQIYIQLQRQRDIKTLEHQLAAFSENARKTELYSKLALLAETLRSLISSDR